MPRKRKPNIKLSQSRNKSMGPFSLKFTSRTVNTWKDFIDLYSEEFYRGSFIFRGQAIEATCPWKFQTELERAWLRVAGTSSARKKDRDRRALREKLEGRTIWEIETGLIREFKRKSSLYLNRSKPEHRLEWLALMRHYGAPTRLLDWTYSFYVAAFFSLIECSSTRPATIWALDVKWVESQMSTTKVPEGSDGNLWDILFKDVHLENPCTWEMYFTGRYSFVLPVNPFALNKRLTIQQGLFLCPGNISIPFEDNLATRQKGDPNSANALIRIKLDLNTTAKKDFLRHLYRMNITKASLFPGLQGFAQSLSMRLLFPKALAAKSSFDANASASAQ